MLIQQVCKGPILFIFHTGGLGSESKTHLTGEEDLLGPEMTPMVLSEISDLEADNRSQEVASWDASDWAATDHENSSVGGHSGDDQVDVALLGLGESQGIILDAALNDIQLGHVLKDLSPLNTTDKCYGRTYNFST